MTGILASVGSTLPSRVHAAVGRLASLGGEVEQFWNDGDRLLTVTRKSWELEDDFSGPMLLLVADGVVVAADASLYGREALAREIEAAGVRPEGHTPSHLIAAAYRAWGSSLAEHLRGDYAFVLWDSVHRRLVAARDPMGSRPLFYAQTATGIAVASSSRALALLVGGAAKLNFACLGAQVAGLAWSSGSDTAYDGVDPVPPGHVLLFDNTKCRLERCWRPPAATTCSSTNLADAAVELRSLLGTAVLERLGRAASTVWMSGGWDSTAVFASAQHVLRADERSRIRPVSISYPANDPGCEDDLIELVAKRWSANVLWLKSDDIPLLDALEQRAAAADEPPAHLYELWNRALAQGTRAADARISLDGCGGDQLFQVSDVIVADLIRNGRWIEAARYARVRRRGWRHLMRLGVIPLLPNTVVDTVDRLAARSLPRHYLERSVADWMRPEFVAKHELRDRDIMTLRRGRGESFVQSESILFLTLPIWSWGASYMRTALLDEGVEARSPLLDLRVIEFALARPAAERTSVNGTKALLRAAMQGLLPERFLAPRTHRTGTTVGFSRQRMRDGYPALFARIFAQPLRLADLGIVEPSKLRAAADRLVAGGDDDFLRINLYHAMKVEFWLRGLDARAPAGHTVAA